MSATTIRGCGAICKRGDAILEETAQLEEDDTTWRRRCDLEKAVVRLGIEGSYAMLDFFCNGEERDGGERAGV
jgi:hypothetical protein